MPWRQPFPRSRALDPDHRRRTHRRAARHASARGRCDPPGGRSGAPASTAISGRASRVLPTIRSCWVAGRLAHAAAHPIPPRAVTSEDAMTADWVLPAARTWSRPSCRGSSTRSRPSTASSSTSRRSRLPRSSGSSTVARPYVHQTWSDQGTWPRRSGRLARLRALAPASPQAVSVWPYVFWSDHAHETSRHGHTRRETACVAVGARSGARSVPKRSCIPPLLRESAQRSTSTGTSASPSGSRATWRDPPTPRFCSSARRPVTAAHGSPASHSRWNASSLVMGRARRAQPSSTASSQTWRSRTTSAVECRSRRTPGTATSNRPPTRLEITAALPFARELARGRRVLAVGGLAEAALSAPYARHPSHGGAAAFREKLACRVPSLDLDRVVRRNTFLARRDARRQLRLLRPARRGRVLADVRPRLRASGTPRARPRNLPRRRSVHRRERRARDGPVRTKPGAGSRLHRAQPEPPTMKPTTSTGLRPNRSIARPATAPVHAAATRKIAGPSPRSPLTPVTRTNVSEDTAATSCTTAELTASVAASRNVLRRTTRSRSSGGTRQASHGRRPRRHATDGGHKALRARPRQSGRRRGRGARARARGRRGARQ